MDGILNLLEFCGVDQKTSSGKEISKNENRWSTPSISKEVLEQSLSDYKLILNSYYLFSMASKAIDRISEL